MGRNRSFKSDDSFLEKISMGAVGTKRVFSDLQEQGHHPIELERGSMSFKIWKTVKIKRIRVPDILCVKCNRRIESRAKTNLEITMSHSHADSSRAWDYGLDDYDYVALVVCYRTGTGPIDWKAEDLVQYVNVGKLREAFRLGIAVEEKPKGAEEGFEVRVTWPSTKASADGIVRLISDDRLQFTRLSDEHTISLNRTKKERCLVPLCNIGDVIRKNQIILSTVPVVHNFECNQTVSVQHYIEQTHSLIHSEKYAAVKALAYFISESSSAALADILQTKEHIYIRLEAAAGLARRGDAKGLRFIKECLSSNFIEEQLEAVIVLGEIDTLDAAKMLITVLRDRRFHSEIRAGAAWALGEMRYEVAIDALVYSFLEVDENIRIEAARALAKFTDTSSQVILEWLAQSESRIKPGIAWALGKSKQLAISDILKILVDEDTRVWAAYVIGMGNPNDYVHQIEALRHEDPEVYFAVTVLWQIMNSWIRDLQEYG